MLDRQPGKDACQPTCFGRFDTFDQVVDLLLAHAFEFKQFVAFVFEPVDIAEVSQQARICELDDGLFAQCINVHLVAADEVDQSLTELSRAFGVGAIACGFIERAQRIRCRKFFRGSALFLGFCFFAFDSTPVDRQLTDTFAVVFDLGRGVALWALIWCLDGFLATRSHIGNDLDDLRDNLAGLFDDNRVIEADIFAKDFAIVVKRCMADGGAGEQGGLHGRARGELAGLADLPIHFQQLGAGLLGGELVCDAPAWGLAGHAKLVLQVVVIDLDHDPVGRERQVVPQLVKALDPYPGFLCRIDKRLVLMNGHAPLLEVGDEVTVAGVFRRDLALAVGDELQAANHLGGVFLFECSGGGVARVHEGVFAALDFQSIHLIKDILGQVDFTSDFKDVGDVTLE